MSAQADLHYVDSPSHAPVADARAGDLGPRVPADGENRRTGPAPGVFEKVRGDAPVAARA
ncbi:hypothetical protein [Saccharothrix sp. NRRL B-16314]|uniref:hypothetical protein n=1 Tax=Saccharothrix sp. NRRL B-16314 TaxID=1463825 RepID=UPI0005253D75|nr:hypothetical protein [Saccharothrix sp. NRRL B-16314]